ncbi:hypothetical protein FOA43_000106 [Brettanomyces nanus]|uniref:RRM domain-containing protein n=1 Tax=Eeniella nana TaxID=13502 RepID=A0A875S015_EENNA|nr:uncharacterized protein FOA43_000106 [Brettanomyces nanus]QPG72804.1 hypothetical protein FOA43_000106 [Brettanomyces nanus]
MHVGAFPQPQPVYMNLSNSNSAPNLYKNGNSLSGRKLTSSLSEATFTSEEDVPNTHLPPDPNLSSRLVQDVQDDDNDEKLSTDGSVSPLAYPSSPSPPNQPLSDTKAQQPLCSSKTSEDRTIKFSKLEKSNKVKDILNLIEFGPIESCQVHHPTISADDNNNGDDDDDDGKSHAGDDVDSNTNTKLSASLSFVSPAVAVRCYTQLKEMLPDLKTALNSPELELKLVTGEPLSQELRDAIKRDGASRGICVSNLPKGVSQSNMLKELRKYGEIEALKYKLSKNSAFVYFTCIASAVSCLSELSSANREGQMFSQSKIFYAPDKNTSQTNIPDSVRGAIDSYYTSVNDSLGDMCLTPSTSISSPRASASRIFRHSSSTSSSARFNSQMELPMSIPAPGNVPPTLVPSSAGVLPGPYSSFPEYASVSPFVHSTSSTFNSSMSPLSGTFAEQQIYSQNSHHGHSSSLNDALDAIPDNLGNRTIYLGNLDSVTNQEDICNVVRGGILESVKLLRDRRVCFVTFIHSEDAAEFMSRATSSGVYVRSRCLKVAWGRNSGPLRPQIEEAIENGACRNLYIGIVRDEDENSAKEDTEPDPEEPAEHQKEKTSSEPFLNSSNASEGTEIPEEQTLRRDFSFFGGIEQINYFEDGRCAFVNFFNILSCMKAVESFNGPDSQRTNASFHGRYTPFKISFGKDRCGIPPKKKKKKKNRTSRSSSSADNEGNDNKQFEDSKFRAALDGMQISSTTLEEKKKEEHENKMDAVVEEKTEEEIKQKMNSSSTKLRKPSEYYPASSDSSSRSHSRHDRRRRPSRRPLGSNPFGQSGYENTNSYYKNDGNLMGSPMAYYGNGGYYSSEGQVGSPAMTQGPGFYMHGGYSLSSPQLVPPSQPGYYVPQVQMYYQPYPQSSAGQYSNRPYKYQHRQRRRFSDKPETSVTEEESENDDDEEEEKGGVSTEEKHDASLVETVI